MSSPTPISPKSDVWATYANYKKPVRKSVPHEDGDNLMMVCHKFLMIIKEMLDKISESGSRDNLENKREQKKASTTLAKTQEESAETLRQQRMYNAANLALFIFSGVLEKTTPEYVRNDPNANSANVAPAPGLQIARVNRQPKWTTGNAVNLAASLGGKASSEFVKNILDTLAQQNSTTDQTKIESKKNKCESLKQIGSEIANKRQDISSYKNTFNSAGQDLRRNVSNLFTVACRK